MAKIKSIFLSGIETIFSIFEESVKSGEYSLIADNGFGTTSTTKKTVRCIFDKFTQEDLESLSFSSLIQPTDIKGLIPVVDLQGVAVNVKGIYTLSSDVYTVEGFEVDPLEVLYIVLLRKN